MDDPLPDPVPPLTDVEKAELEEIYPKLKDEAMLAAREYLLAHIPPRLQKDAKAKVDGDFPEPQPATPPADQPAQAAA